MTTNPPRRDPARVSGLRLTIGLCIGITAVAFEALAVATAMPRAAEDLEAKEWYAWAFSIFQAAMLFATIAAGRLCDRIGPSRPMALGFVIFTAGLLVAGFAPVMTMLIIGRGIQGLGAGLFSVSLYVIVAKAYSAAERPKVFTWISTAWVLPGFIGPLIAGWLTERLSWHWVFFSVIPFLALAAGLLGPLLIKLERMRVADRAVDTQDPQDPAKGVVPAPIWAAGVLAIAVPVLQFAVQRPTWWSIPLGVVGVGLLALGLPKVMPPRFFRFGRGIAPVIGVRGLIGGTYFAAEAFTVLMLTDMYDLPPSIAGLMLTVGTVGWTTGSYVQARWRIRRDQLMTLGTASLAVGIIAVALIAWFHAPYALVAVAWAVSALGMGTAFSSTSLAVMTLSATQEQGRNASSLQLGEALTASLTSAMIGGLYAFLLRVAPAEQALVFGPLLSVVAVLAVLAIVVSRRVGPVAH
ncbi:MAG: MFS transporter [Propionibacteriales bacterium]|nr:MFS transporter [Propionibacteriales bacterium]